MLDELFIWRPILEQMVSLADVKQGIVDIDDISKLNALLNMRAAQERAAMDKARNNP